MWVAGGKYNKPSSSSSLSTAATLIMMLIMIIILLTKVGATRPFPLRMLLSIEISDNDNDNHLKKQVDLFSKYFNLTSLSHNNSTNTTAPVVYDVKRTVPSCPDPLHN
ncbi:hypothetical protein vseg_004718 [Gypsophila vaccaria]